MPASLPTEILHRAELDPQEISRYSSDLSSPLLSTPLYAMVATHRCRSRTGARHVILWDGVSSCIEGPLSIGRPDTFCRRDERLGVPEDGSCISSVLYNFPSPRHHETTIPLRVCFCDNCLGPRIIVECFSFAKPSNKRRHDACVRCILEGGIPRVFATSSWHHPL
jgi:hypothetical protein